MAFACLGFFNSMFHSVLGGYAVTTLCFQKRNALEKTQICFTQLHTISADGFSHCIGVPLQQMI